MTGTEYIKMWAERVAIRIDANNKQNRSKRIEVQPPRPIPAQYQLWKLVLMLQKELRERGYATVDTELDTYDRVIRVGWR